MTYTDCHSERYYLKVRYVIQNEVLLFMPATSLLFVGPDSDSYQNYRDHHQTYSLLVLSPTNYNPQ